MANNRYMLLRAFVLAAKKTADEQGTPATPTTVLEDIVLGKFTTELSDGKTLISTDEAGGTATFALMGTFTAIEVVALAMEAITWLRQQPDPDDPEIYPSRRIRRLRVSFDKAVI